MGSGLGTDLDPVFFGCGLVPMVDRGGPWCLVSVIAVKAQIVKVSICSRQLSVARRKRSGSRGGSVLYELRRVERDAPTKVRCGGGQAEAKVSRAASIGGLDEISVCPMEDLGGGPPLLL